MGFTPPNQMYGGAANRGSSSGPMSGTPQAGRGVMPTGDRFQVSESKMPQPPSAVQLGKGMIPVNPYDNQGKPQTSATMPDTAPIPRMPWEK